MGNSYEHEPFFRASRRWLGRLPFPDPNESFLAERFSDPNLIKRISEVSRNHEIYWGRIRSRVETINKNRLLIEWSKKFGIVKTVNGKEHLLDPSVGTEVLCSGLTLQGSGLTLQEGLLSYRQGIPKNLCGKCISSRKLKWWNLTSPNFGKKNKTLAYFLWAVLLGSYQGPGVGLFHLRKQNFETVCGHPISEKGYLCFIRAPEKFHCHKCKQRISLQKVSENLMSNFFPMVSV